jgi:sulfate transport system permease protein
VAIAYLSIVALIPLAAVVSKAFENGADGFWTAVSNPQAVAALKLTLVASVLVVLINAVFGTLIAWVLVRDEFPGKGIVNSMIDLPVRAAYDRGRPDPAGLLRPRQPGRP